MNMEMGITCIGFLILLLCETVKTSNVLLLTLPVKSCMFPMVSIGRALQYRGHRVSILSSEGMFQTPVFRPDDTFDRIMMSKVQTIDEIFSDISKQKLKEESSSFIPLPIGPIRKISSLCDSILSDKNMFLELKKRTFDMIIIDNIPFAHFMHIIPYKLSVPFIHLGLLYDLSIFASRIPYLPSFVPSAVTTFTDEMTFLQRLANTLITIIVNIELTILHPGVPSGALAKYAPEMPSIAMADLYAQAQIILSDHDVLIDYPKPSLPHVIFVGGLQIEPPRPLQQGQLKQFMDSATGGVVLVSFGSVTEHVPTAISDKMLEAFRRINMTVVWKTDVPQSKDKNILMQKWIPQNDVLAHVNTKLFITHCGHKGQLESLYNGVPMLGLPVFLDQPYNAARIAHKGYGIAMDLKTCTVVELVSGIKEVLSNPTYTAKIKKASEIFHSRKESSRDKAVYWIEHVIKYGAQHLRASSLDMPFYQYYLLDVFIFLLTVSVVLLWFFMKVLRLCCILCCCGTMKKDKKD